MKFREGCKSINQRDAKTIERKLADAKEELARFRFYLSRGQAKTP